MANDLIPEQAPRDKLVAGERIAALVPTSLPEAMTLATMIAKSGMVPKAFADKDGTVDPGRVLVGIMAGAEVGLAPFQALQSIAVIGNMPSLWGDGALALIQGSGLLVDIVEEWDEAGQVATCTMVRKGRATPIVRTFSVKDAEKAKLTGKSGPWQEYRRRMCQMRARSWAMRDGFPDVLKGLHIAEEAQDVVDAATQAEPARTIKVSDLRQAAQADDPVAVIDGETGEILDEATPAGDDAADDVEPSEVETRRLIGLFDAVSTEAQYRWAGEQFQKSMAALSTDQVNRIHSAMAAVEARRDAAKSAKSATIDQDSSKGEEQ